MVGSRRGLLVAILVWLVLFGLTVQVGISDWVLKSLLEDPTATIVGAAVDLLLLIPLVLTHRALMRDLLEPSPRWYLALYALLVVAGALVPLHYHLALPVGVYIGFISVSVVWGRTSSPSACFSTICAGRSPWA